MQSGEVTPKTKRNLVLVAKLLQTLVNETPFEKEVCMLPFNEFIHDHVPVVHSMFLAWMVPTPYPMSCATHNTQRTHVRLTSTAGRPGGATVAAVPERTRAIGLPSSAEGVAAAPDPCPCG